MCWWGTEGDWNGLVGRGGGHQFFYGNISNYNDILLIGGGGGTSVFLWKHF